MRDASPDILARGVVATVLSWVVIEVALKQTNPTPFLMPSPPSFTLGLFKY
jgi:hypothetical protein